MPCNPLFINGFGVLYLSCFDCKNLLDFGLFLRILWITFVLFNIVTKFTKKWLFSVDNFPQKCERNALFYFIFGLWKTFHRLFFPPIRLPVR